MNTTLVAVGLIAHLVLTLPVPALRFRRRHGEWPTTLHRHGDPVQRAIGRLLALLIGAGLVWAVLLVAMPETLGLWARPDWVGALGWALLAAGTALEVAAQRAMGASFRIGIDERPTALVTGGLFRCSRNPLFTGLMTALLGLVLLTPSAWTALFWLWTASLIVIQVHLEEAHLRRVHGEAYEAYCRRVGRFAPRLGMLIRSRQVVRGQ